MSREAAFFEAANRMPGACAEIGDICHSAWLEGFMPGASGNASRRLGPDFIAISASGAHKGRLGREDCLLYELQGPFATGSPSTESALHRAIYLAFEDCGAILHTHPPGLQALNLILSKSGPDWRRNFLNLDLYEAAVWRPRLAFCAKTRPGSPELGPGALQALQEAPEKTLPRALWLESHGLAALGENLAACLALTEELEHLAHVQLEILGR